MTPLQMATIDNWHKEHPEKISEQLPDHEEAFINLCRFWAFWNLPPRPARYVFTITPERMKQLMLIALSRMTEEKELELDTDPAQLDGQFLDHLEPSEEYAIDERTIHDNKEDHQNPHAAIGLYHEMQKNS